MLHRVTETETEQALADLHALREDVAHIRSVLDRAMPVIDAYLAPTASGPVAWAVRQRMRKGAQSG